MFMKKRIQALENKDLDSMTDEELNKELYHMYYYVCRTQKIPFFELLMVQIHNILESRGYTIKYTTSTDSDGDTTYEVVCSKEEEIAWY